MRFFAVIAASVMVILFYSESSAVTEHITIDDVNYRIVSDQRTDMKEIDLFHPLFIQAADEIFQEYNLKKPLSFQITITYGAWIFKNITGYEKETAALWLHDHFVFQRPSALQKKDLLIQAIRHELFHCAVETSRREKSTDVFDSLWIEESVASALYPVGFYNIADGEKALHKIKDTEAVKKYLNRSLKSSNEREKRLSYSVAAAYGNQIIRRDGKARAFVRAVQGY